MIRNGGWLILEAAEEEDEEEMTDGASMEAVSERGDGTVWLLFSPNEERADDCSASEEEVIRAHWLFMVKL